jgi:hypothetical protein
MTRTIGPGLPAAGLALGVLGLALWVAAISLASLDLLVGGLLGIALAASLAGYFFGSDGRVRRLAVIALGWNAAALTLVAIVYAAG